MDWRRAGKRFAPQAEGVFRRWQNVIRVKAEELSPGMVVAREVKNIDGMLLAPAGCELSERQIGILQAWGIAEVEVEAGEEQARAHDPLAQLPPETLAKITAVDVFGSRTISAPYRRRFSN
jgi:hypothetical protein